MAFRITFPAILNVSQFKWFRKASEDTPDYPLAQLHGGKNGRVVLVFLLGVDEKRIPDVVRRASSHIRRFRRRPVFVVASGDLGIFRELSEIAEVLPSPKTISFIPDLPWRQYLMRRRAMLSAKWRPELVLTYGTSFDSYVDSVDMVE